jgi:gliding-associated putative ABC transporter substrate-binding component GldG
LEDQLFKYGVRINRDLIKDKVAGKYPVVVNESRGERPDIVTMEWPFFPLIINYASHPMTRNLDASELRFVSSIDTVKAVGVKKTPLLFTSPYTDKVGAPVRIDIRELEKNVNEGVLDDGPLPVGYLLEGSFSSLYKNRFLPQGVDTTGYKKNGNSSIIVISDGDIARNELNPRTGQPLALGLDAVTGYTFANQNLLMNMVAFLVEENGLITARNKEIKIRPLDREKIKDQRLFWQSLNLAGPIVFLILFGIIKTFMRKRKYATY